ncbi:protein of unknown function [Ruminococcaceae bacterium BL-6]|nr:protein of unknown function [Ruminococcaceae bacterium BL-6]
MLHVAIVIIVETTLFHYIITVQLIIL